jgi:hypothetical protein
VRACVGVCFAALGALLGGACERHGDARPPLLFTVADFQALRDAPEPPQTIADGYGVPGGLRLDRIIAQDAAGASLAKRDVYTHGYKSAYLTTEVWAGFDEVWVQPVYVAVDGAYPIDKPPARLKGKSGTWRPIFSVGPDSAFYSPYWETIYFRIPADVDIDTIQSVRDVYAHGFDFRRAEGRVMVLAPAEVGVPPRHLEAKNGEELVGGPTPSMGVYDGQDAPFLDFGTSTFEWNDRLEVDEVPLYVWVTRDATGALQTLDMPTVGGSGPPYSGLEPRVIDGKPKYGSYWRIYTVEIQPGWRVFAPPFFDDVRKRLATTEYLYEDPPYADDLKKLTDPVEATSFDDWVGRVLKNPDCVKNPVAVDPSNVMEPALMHDGVEDPLCEYVDSQAKIEALVPRAAIRRTDIVVTCPFITYDSAPLVLP